ncbi:bifunctional 2-C-methyl-D-erythritol 4-phosphate cytidylyltransferase/2-C-methyl-D-erythritol 2,4-cyclodiphosphate synthase [Rhizobiaceae bacterium]|nr:bifunctional 2-C-methyl-D-erythritol 4-phosphate cytidylyltransferase/2-C-methyl-D-erythritol 2,4-cyclodiphosphate synthase [Rhizobiaceae bacterium]
MSKTFRTIAIVVAAGRGQRAGTGAVPKQYAMLGGLSVLRRTVLALLACEDVDAVRCVIHPDDRAQYDAAVVRIDDVLTPAIGGATRQDSVAAGLDGLAGFDVVLVHDAARPFVSPAVVASVCEAVSPGVGAVPGVAMVDSLYRSENGALLPVSRKGLAAAQTPQGFVLSDLRAAHEAARAADRHDFTDDATLAQWHGMEIAMALGDAENVKLTTAQDMARAALRFAVPDVRVGHGYDTHQLVPGTSITLCGVEIAHSASLLGHSDADVGLHALTDAVLATVGAGDIGSHFPPSDEQWRGASSDRFLAHAMTLVRDKGGVVTHLDVTLVCEAPKIGPVRDAMRARIAGICGLETQRVSVKATTNETVGFVGRGEGIVALATATAVFPA